jgi:lysophospholipase L1-like esterase
MEALLWILGTGAFLLVLAECFLRRWYKLTGATFVWPPHGRLRLEIDNESLPGLDPIARIEFNRDGERGDEPPLGWDQTARALVVGGSAAECHMLDQDRTWPAVLQRELNRPEALEHFHVERFHVGNISRSLVPCEALHRMLEAVRFRYDRLDLVLLMVGASDVIRWLEHGTPPQLDFGRIPNQDMFALHETGPFGWSPGRLAIRRALAAANERWRRPVLVIQRAGKTLAHLRTMRAEAGEVLDSVPDPTPLLESFETHFRRLIRLAAETADRVIVVRQPWFEEPARGYSEEERAVFWNLGRGRPYLDTIDTYYTHKIVNELLHLQDKAQERIAAEEQVESLYLHTYLEPSLTTWYDYLHLTPTGAEEVGQRVARAVLKQAF